MKRQSIPTERAALRDYVASFSTRREAADLLGISLTHLGDMLQGNRNISKGVLAVLGFVRETTVRKVEK